MTRPVFPFAVPVAAALLLSACSSLMPPAHVPMVAATAWAAPLPHAGTVASLSQWWQAQGDPLLVELIEAAQGVSPSVAQALARIESARANQATARGALLPRVDAQTSASRGANQNLPNAPASTTVQAGLQASWELDLVGANRAVSRAAQAQVHSSQAQWHDARVLVAAEVASLYYSLATCQKLLAVAQKDAHSRQETARLTAINAKAGFLAPSVAAMARASAAEGSSRVTQQSAQCETDVKGLVALTAVPELELLKKLAEVPMDVRHTAALNIANVPAQVVSQRPDVFAAERDVVLASAQVGRAQAQRLPRLTLGGSIGSVRTQTDGVDTRLSTWSFGPLALSVPVFDAGQGAAAVVASEAAYTATVAAYHGKVRQAVREVEEALLNLHSTGQRQGDAQVAADGYRESLAATQARFGQGLASLVELEDTRRVTLAAESALLTLQLERRRAWVTLYRALGGGFDAGALSTAAAK